MNNLLARLFGFGSRNDGVAHWWAQRITAVALVPLCLWFVAALVPLVGADHAQAVAWLRSPLHATLMILLILATFHHTHLGMQVVIEDYVPAPRLCHALIALVRIAALAAGAAALLAVLAVALGG